MLCEKSPVSHHSFAGPYKAVVDIKLVSFIEKSKKVVSTLQLTEILNSIKELATKARFTSSRTRQAMHNSRRGCKQRALTAANMRFARALTASCWTSYVSS